jgi:hypothetical protein
MFKPQIYLPVTAISLWTQYEIQNGSYEAAESLITRYINATTTLKDEESNESITLEFTPQKLKDKPRNPWAAESEKLEIKENEYYHLVSLLLFYVILPRDGYSAAKRMLVSELPMPLEIKEEMLRLLNEAYLTKVRECSLIYGEKAVEKVKKR